MKESQSRLIEKIKALFSKADPARGATKEEQEAAMAKASELMAKYGIEQSDIKFDDGTSPPPSISHVRVVLAREQKYECDENVARILNQCFGVKVLWHTERGRDKKGWLRKFFVYILIGDELDLELARIAVPMLVKAMRLGVSKHLRERGLRGWNANIGRAYYLGVEFGYVQASAQGQAHAYRQEAKHKVDAYAIVLVDKKEAIVQYEKKEFPEKEKNKCTGLRNGKLDPYAFAKGRLDGAGLDLSGTKLTGGGK